MPDLTVDGAKMLANGFLELSRRIEALRDEQEQYAVALERAAHEILKAREAYSRSGSYPTVRGVNERGVTFDVSNGYDLGDDFDVTLSWDELTADPAAEAERRRESERARRLAKARELRKRAERLEAGGQDDD